MLQIRNARHWRTGARIDVLVRDGRIASVTPAAAAGAVDEPAVQNLDARGAVLAPGLVDLHVHLREPGQSAKETIETGTRAAAAGGFTAVACMPNTEPVLDDPARVEWVRSRAEHAYCRVHPIAAVTVGQRGEQLTEFGALKAAGAVALSDDGRPIASAAIMRRALEYARRFDLPIVCHEEDPSLKGDGVINEGPIAIRLGLRGIPSAAESVMVRRDVELAELTGGRVHIAHVSCSESLEALRDAKRRGLAVTGETCPHYWILTDEAVGDYDTRAKMNPPLRSARDRDAVIRAVADGTLDCFVTDHAPHTAEEKRQPFALAPFGIVGLETALALTITHLVEPGHISLERALELWTEAPRRIFALDPVSLTPGSPADLVLIDPSAEWSIEAARFHSNGRSTPFQGWNVKGKVLATICEGTITHRDESTPSEALQQSSRPNNPNREKSEQAPRAHTQGPEVAEASGETRMTSGRQNDQSQGPEVTGALRETHETRVAQDARSAASAAERGQDVRAPRVSRSAPATSDPGPLKGPALQRGPKK